MSLPDFTNDEQYLINSIKSSDVSVGNSYMWGYLVGGALIAGFALYHDSVMMMLAAFVFISGSRIYEERSYKKWLPLWKSIIEKYEAAIAATDDKNV